MAGDVASWTAEGQRQARSALDVLRDWLPANQAEAKRRADAFEVQVRALRCQYHRMVGLAARLGNAPKAAQDAAWAAVIDVARRYMRHVGGTWGSYDAAEAVLSKLDPQCNPGVGVAPVVVVGVVAALGLTGAAGAYAVSSSVEAWRDVQLAEHQVRRVEALLKCLSAGGSEQSCLAAMGPAPEIRDGLTAAEAVAKGGASAAQSASTGVLGLGLAVAAAAGLFLWVRS